jgi:hypothetical protein
LKEKLIEKINQTEKEDDSLKPEIENEKIEEKNPISDFSGVTLREAIYNEQDREEKLKNKND